MKSLSAEKKVVAVEKILLLIAVVLLVAGFLRVEDYGISFDEGTEFNTMKLTYQYADYVIAHLLGADVADDSGFLEYADNIYGVAVRYPLYVLASKIPMTVKTFFIITHYYTYLWFCGAVGALYYLVKKITGKKYLAALGSIMLICSPRIAGEAFYNIKDNMFFSLFLITLAAGYYFIKQRKKSGMVFFAFISALCINTRYIGGIILLLVVFQYVFGGIRQGKGIMREIGKGIGICALCYAFYFLMTPFLWENPLVNTWKIIASFSDYGDGVMSMMYCGDIVYSDSLPWHYLAVWIIITTPLPVTALFMAENALALKRVFVWLRSEKELRKKRLNSFVQNDEKMFCLLVGGIVWLTIAADIIIQPIKYDGWRHFYFLYGPMLFVAIMGLFHLSEWIKKKCGASVGTMVAGNVICFGLIAVSCLGSVLWGIKNHPYEFLYFNPLCRAFETSFERDYWYVSTYDAVEEILRMEEEDNIRIFCVCKTVTLLLEDAELSRVEFVDNMESADYVILQYRAATIEELKLLCADMQLLSEKEVDGLPIYSIYYAQ